MPEETQTSSNRAPLTEEEIRSCTVGALQPLSSRIQIVEYDPQWPELFHREAERIRAVLGPKALQIEHAGSTSVPGLAAKPVIDIVLVVTDSADEAAYVLFLGESRLRVAHPGTPLA